MPILRKILVVVFLGSLLSSAYAQDAATAAATTPSPFKVAPLETEAKHAYLVEAATGDVLYAKDADATMATSSMSKVLTMYLVFEAIRNGKLKLTDEVPVSDHAWKQEGSRMFINANDKVKVEDLIRGVIVQSGNDAAVALAEALGGAEGEFAGMMNTKAQQLGMTHSHFTNATGLPDPDHYSTAHDLATLALNMIRDFPEDYHYYAETEFTYNNIKQGNRNPLLYRGIGVDGLKTGHTEEAGYGLIASALRNGRRLILVVNGLSNMQERADESAKILEWGYREFGLYPTLRKGEKLADAKVWLGVEPTVPVVPEKDFIISLPRNQRHALQVTLIYNQPIPAPVQSGQVLGKALVNVPGKNVVEVPLIAGNNVAEVGFFRRLKLKLKLLLGKL